jgi:RNA polymerase sigma-70 factor (ECF subfamily)
MTDRLRARLDAVYRAESRRVYATLVRLLGDLDLAEEALHDAFAAALERWPAEGEPARPVAWLISTGRFRAIDTLRRRARLDPELAAVAERVEDDPLEALAAGEVPDERLRLVFLCCHPALEAEARVALTLREVCGLSTEEIARAYLAAPAAIAQRIVRAKARIRAERIPCELPGPDELAARLDAVLRVVYLLFNEGYASSAGEELLRRDLASEALRLGRLVAELLPAPEPEVDGLVALMLLHDARRDARATPAGDLVLLADQDRSRWDRARIAAGAALVERALRSRRFGPYTLQAAIAAVHAEAPRSEDTDWAQIVGLYDLLLRVEPSPVVALNRAVALAMRDGPAAGLEVVEGLFAGGALADYVPAHAVRADLCRRLGRPDEARAAYRRALAIARMEPERRFLRGRLAELG